MTVRQPAEILKLVDGIWFDVGPDAWSIGSTKVFSGEWVAFVPDQKEAALDPSGPLAWILATMSEPLRGTVELLGEDIYRRDDRTRLRMRARIGFVHSYGGLISNRTVRENIALPVSIHAGLSARDEARQVTETLDTFGLTRVANLKPHEMDGSTRWRACLARALVLNPDWLVLEGIGNWEMDQGRGIGWTALRQRQETHPMATAICLPCPNPGFETWFAAHRGQIVRYNKQDVV
ncbi:MAG: ATP-binding cassette domain-containing protein [Myxococcota bacterium]|nr:ATP-binding cassette domain-containing protein [Myxococcota bacterium]